MSDEMPTPQQVTDPEFYRTPASVTTYHVGLDLGQVNDFSAAVVERTDFPRYRKPTLYAVRHLVRWPLSTRSPKAVEGVRRTLPSANDRGEVTLARAHLVVDVTGVGKAVVDLLRQLPEVGGRVRAVTITGGTAVNMDEAGNLNVPTKGLVVVLQVLMGSGRLKVADRLPHAETLLKELSTFRVRISASGNETFESWRERDHGDLVLAVACACWAADRLPPYGEPYTPGVFAPGFVYGEGHGGFRPGGRKFIEFDRGRREGRDW
jgi:hypothetical protein